MVSPCTLSFALNDNDIIIINIREKDNKYKGK